MRSTSDPARAWRLRTRWALLPGFLALALSLGWALAPLPPVAATDPYMAPPAPDEEDAELAEPLDREAFAARIWNPPAQPPAAPPAPQASPTPPPRLQLIGIVHDTDGEGTRLLRAALYDPDTDRLHLVASGERIGIATVSGIDRDGVMLEAEGRTSRLALRDEPKGGTR